MTHQPTISQTNRNTQRKFNRYLGTCDFSVPPRSGRLSSGSGIQLLLLCRQCSTPSHIVVIIYHYIGYKYKATTWYLTGFPNGSNLGSTV